MKVTFTRTGIRRYRVSVEGPGVVSSVMDPAPGYDPRMPHDMAHFIVESEFGISGGVFGQLAGGGHASTFRPIEPERSGRKARTGMRISAANRSDALLSERLVDLVQRKWLNDPQPAIPIKGVTDEELEHACGRFNEISEKWSKLAVGESLVLDWLGGKGRQKRRKKT